MPEKKLIAFGTAAREIRSAEEARFWTYQRQDGSFPPTRLLNPDNPFNEEIKKARSVLEIGCGSGRNLPYIMENCPYAKYYGVEPNQSMLRWFWELNDRRFQDRAYVTYEFDEVLLSQKFDLVITTFVLQHIGYRPVPPAMNVGDITQVVLRLMKEHAIWFSFEYDAEERWIGRWMSENKIRPQVYIRYYAGFPELNDHTFHHLIIWKRNSPELCSDAGTHKREDRNVKVACIVGMGTSDQILTLPAIRYLHNLSNVELEIILGESHHTSDLFPLLLGGNVKIALLQDFWKMKTRQKQQHAYDWILDLDYSNPCGIHAAPDWLIARQQYFTFQREQTRVRQKTYGLRDESGSQYWQRCFEMAFQLGSQVKNTSFSREEMLAARDSFRISKLPAGSQSVENRINRLLSKANAGPLLIVSPGGYPAEKRWPADRFAEVICFALQQGINVVVLSLRKDSDSLWKIFELIRSRPFSWKRITPGNLTFLNGKVKHAILPYLLQRAVLHLSNENSLAQIAGTLDIPQILLYRGTHSMDLPPGRQQKILFSNQRHRMDGIDVQSVMDLMKPADNRDSDPRSDRLYLMGH